MAQTFRSFQQAGKRAMAMQETMRDTDLQAFLDELKAAIERRAPDGSAPAKAATRAFAALSQAGEAADPTPEQAPAAANCLPAALAAAADGPTGDLARAFATIAPRLAWRTRPDRSTADPDFARAHAGAVIVGDGGLEARTDVRIGASLLAPRTYYPNHHHPPEEVYVALSTGCWRQDAGPWREPGPGRLIYNPPDILHAMHSKAEPLLAIWTLPIDAKEAQP